MGTLSPNCFEVHLHHRGKATLTDRPFSTAKHYRVSLSSVYSLPSFEFYRFISLRRFLPLSPTTIRRSTILYSSAGSTSTTTARRVSHRNPFFSEGRDEDEKRPVCPGCGVIMQDRDPNLPGFYMKRDNAVEESEEAEEISDNVGEVFENHEEEDEDGMDDDDDDDVDEDDGDVSEGQFDPKDEIDWNSDWEIEDEEEEWSKSLDGFALAGVGYGNVTEDILEKKAVKITKSEKKKQEREAKRKEEANRVLVCARCHSLRHYGQLKNQKLENLIPDFDFDRLIANRLMKASNSSVPVIVMVVDCVDFDGSFPRRAAKSLFESMEKKGTNASKFSRLPKLVLVGTKVDLLPSQVSPTRLVKWVRNRARANGAPKLSGVHLVSSKKDLGIRNLLSFVKELAGPRGNVWVIGAQNAGKSTLINAFAKREGVKITRLTEAAVPGTTLGILRIKGILPANAKLYDTPGLLHPYLVSTRLNLEELKMVEMRKELQPRTYRIKVGQAVHLGALARLDLIHSSVQTIYVTIWASPNLSLHLGKLENADEIFRKHAGVRLQPPSGTDRVPNLGDWQQREIHVSGVSWEVNSTDIAIAGLGWYSLGLKGSATIALWTYNGVEVTIREPLVLDRSPFLERPGFLLPKAVSDAIEKETSIGGKNKRLNEDRGTQPLVEASST
ncbi:GTP-binding protein BRASSINAZOLE INSENSITIVE PALE GREEN 2 [Nymphaea thermarum]|nr:GTP-binding protein BRASSINAZOLE INSENSITIVE PALE GREEN 2 [Nymphaea thermarum]